jgi:creatinine amidohydrolase
VLLEEITMDDFVAGLAKTRTVIIPFGSVEEHGPHLPLGTDTIHVYEISKLAAAQAAVFVAPPLFYGVCRSTRNHAGTVSIRPSTLRAIMTDLVSDLYRQGLRHFIILSGHASELQVSCLAEVGEQLLVGYPDIRLAVLSIFALAMEAWQQVIVTQDDAHAGEIETSVMLHLRGRLVGEKRPREWPRFPKHLLVRDKLRYWPGGVWGDSSQATVEKGKKVCDLSVTALVHLVKELDAHAEPQ